jgi:flagellar biosynthetic protein FliO
MIRFVRRPSEPNRPMARRLEAARPRGVWSIGRVAVIAAGAGMAIVAGVGILNPQPVAGGGQPAPASAAPTDLAATAGSLWDSGSVAGMDWFGLVTKCLLVLVLLYITLRFLNRMQTASPKKAGRLQVLESRPLAQKASLHLVAVGDRRLVVGLTPNGMVALAELDAGELEAAVADAEAAAADGSVPAAQIQPAFGAVFAAVSAPIDAITGRLAGFLGGGRIR